VGAAVGLVEGRGVGLPGRYVGATLGAAEGACVGAAVGCGVGRPGTYEGAFVGRIEGAGEGLGVGRISIGSVGP